MLAPTDTPMRIIGVTVSPIPVSSAANRNVENMSGAPMKMICKYVVAAVVRSGAAPINDMMGPAAK